MTEATEDAGSEKTIEAIIEFLSINLQKIPLNGIPERRIALHDSCILGTFPMYAEEAGIDLLTTFCGGCHQSLAPLENRFPFEIANYISLVAESVGVRHEDVYKKYAGCGDIEQILSDPSRCIAAAGLSVDALKKALPAYVEPFRSK